MPRPPFNDPDWDGTARSSARSLQSFGQDDLRAAFLNAVVGIRADQQELNVCLSRWEQVQKVNISEHMAVLQVQKEQISQHTQRLEYLLTLPSSVLGLPNIVNPPFSNGPAVDTDIAEAAVGGVLLSSPCESAAPVSKPSGSEVSEPTQRSSSKDLVKQRSDEQVESDEKALAEHKRLSSQMTVGVRKKGGDSHMAPDSGPPVNRLSLFISSSTFNYVISTVILLNTVFIGMETDATMTRLYKEPGTDEPGWYRAVNLVFTSIFSAELVLRVAALRWYFFTGSEWRWNYFDSFLVMTSVMQETLSFVNMSFVRILRIFRIVRITRIIRVLRFFTELRRMVCAVAGSIASLVWAFGILLLMTYCFAIFIMQGGIGYVETHGASDSNAQKIRGVCGDLYQAMYSLIMAISGGTDWGLLADPLAAQSEFYRLSFIAYVVFIVFGVLNVLTGIFVAESAQILDRDLLIYQEMNHKKMFAVGMWGIFGDLDKDGSGDITEEELKECMQDPRIVAYLEAYALDTTDMHTMFKLLDHDNSGTIKLMDFIAGAFKLKGAAKAMHLRKVQDDFTTAVANLQSQIADVQSFQERAFEK